MSRRVLCLGPSALVLTGETFATRNFIRCIEEVCNARATEVRTIFVASQSSGALGLLSRAQAYGLIFLLSIKDTLRGSRPNLYLVCPGHRAAFFVGILLFFIRPFVHEIVCHHHGRRWFKSRNAFLAYTVFSRRIYTLTQCDTLVAMIKAQYPQARAFPMSNAWLVPEAPSTEIPAPNAPTILGYISNLTFEKGLDTAVDTLAATLDKYPDVSLQIAGQPQSQDVAQYLDAAIGRGLPVTLLGFVDSPRKTAFFQTIHVLLFPTRYAVEAEPLVTLEALAHGVPVLSTDIGCLGRNIAGSGGFAFHGAMDFPAKAKQIVEGWRTDPETYNLARRLARQRHASLRLESQEQLRQNLLDRLVPDI